jgi:hypothetical protein
MKTGALKRALLLVALYCGLFVLLVVLQFSKGPGLSERIGNLAVSATYSKSSRGQADATPDKLKLSYAGLAFELSPQAGAVGLGADGSTKPLALQAVAKIAGGVRIKFSSGVELKAVVNKDGTERFALAASAPDNIAAVRLKLSPSSSFSLADKAGSRVLQAGSSSFSFLGSPDALDANAGTLTLKAGDAGLGLAVLAPPAPAPKPTAGTEKLVAQEPKDPAAFKAEIDAWRDKAWSGLSASRFDAEAIAWKGPDGLSSFSEKALAAYLSESLLRGSYSDALSRVKGAKQKWSDKLSYFTEPYLGSVLTKMRAFETADPTEVKRISQLVADKSPVLFETEGLVRFLFDRAPQSLAQDAFAFMASADPSKLSVRQVVGLLGCAADAKTILADADYPFRSGSDKAAADRVASLVHKSPSGLYLVSDADGYTDLRLSLLAGSYLVSFGASAAKSSYQGLGQGLVEGVIGLADAQGFVPSRGQVRSGGVEQKTGSLLPEDLYPLVASNPYYPHEVSFGRDADRGLWAWTCAPSLTLQASGSRYDFTAHFYEGKTHYLVFYGLKRFSNIQLYGIDYSPDGEFESYDASGYLYQKNALYMKMKHKKEAEDIVLSF